MSATAYAEWYGTEDPDWPVTLSDECWPGEVEIDWNFTPEPTLIPAEPVDF